MWVEIPDGSCVRCLGRGADPDYGSDTPCMDCYGSGKAWVEKKPEPVPCRKCGADVGQVQVSDTFTATCPSCGDVVQL